MNFLANKSPLDKYLADVKSFLPRKNRDDILEELRTNLAEKLSERVDTSEGEARRRAEIKLLSDFGHPLRIASQYQSGTRSLIGPTLYPFYRMSVLAALIVSTCILLLMLLAEVVFAIDLGEAGRPWMLVNTYIYILGVITTGYALTEFLMQRHRYLDSWQPNALDQPDNAVVSAWGALISCIVATTWLAILNMVPIDHDFPTLLGQIQNPIYTLVLWMKIQTLVLIPQYFYLVFNQTWSRNRLLLRIASELICSVGCVVVLLSNAGALADNYPELSSVLISAFGFVVWTMLVVTVIAAIGYGRKLAKFMQAA